MEQIQMATLTLKTTDLTAGQPLSNGSVDQYRTSMTWNNIDFRLLLGDMYDKYDLFNFKLANIGCSATLLTAGTDVTDRCVTLNLSGINFINNTYNSNTNNLSSSMVIGTYNFYASYSNEYNNSIATFTKGNDKCNISIQYKTIVGDTTPSTLVNFPHMTFRFHIYGIPRVERK